MLGKSIMCFAIAGILICGYFMFINNATSEIQQTNVTGTPYENQYNSLTSLISNSTMVIMAIALIFAGAGVFFALGELNGGKKRYRR